jgi:RHS repeat-associated protein
VLASAGAGASAFGYAGEWTDASGLQYLRARYYDPSVGRFVSRDSWQGNNNQPVSYNKWLYAFSNPIKLSDPTGHVPGFWGIDDYEFVYSCNAGFIDFGHANSSIPASLFTMIAEENAQMANMNSTYRNDVFVIEPKASALGVGTQGLKVVVKTGINNDKAKLNKVALGMYRELMEKIENAQHFIWFTHYSFEDLTSNEIGFYLYLHSKKSVDPRKEDGDNLDAWNWLAGVAGFPEDREESKKQTRKALENMGGLGLFWKTPQIFEWGSPLFCSGMDDFCADNPAWPSEFTEIQPISPQRDKDWWIYDESLDGELIESKYSGFYFLK